MIIAVAMGVVEAAVIFKQLPSASSG